MVGIIIEISCYLLLYKYLWDYGLWWYPFILITPGLCLSISYVCNKLYKIRMGQLVVELIQKIGKHSFEIYLIHIFYFECLNYVIRKGYISDRIAVWLISYVIIMILATAFKKCIDRLTCYVMRMTW